MRPPTCSACAAWRPCRSTSSPPRWASPSRRSCTGSPARTTWCRPCSAAAAPSCRWVVEAAIRAATDDPLDRIDAVVQRRVPPGRAPPGAARAGPRDQPACRRPWRPADAAARPLVDRAVGYLRPEMDAGRLRRADPRLVAALCYATVTGIATEPEALRVVGWDADPADLRRLRTELLAFLPRWPYPLRSSSRGAQRCGVAAAAGVALERQRTSSSISSRVGSRWHPQLRVHRDRGEARDRVDLVEQEAAAASPPRRRSRRGPALAPQRPEDVDARAPAPRRSASAVSGAGMSACDAVVEVLVGVVVELGARHDLARHRRLGSRLPSTATSISRPVIASSTTIHSSYVSGELDGVAAAPRPSWPSTRRPTSPCWPASRTPAGRARPTIVAGSAGRDLVLAARHASGPGGCRAAASTCLAIALSIATAEPSTPAPTYGTVGQLEQALHRAVLAHRAVQQRQHHRARRAAVGVAEHRRRRRATAPAARAAGSASGPGGERRLGVRGELPTGRRGRCRWG